MGVFLVFLTCTNCTKCWKTSHIWVSIQTLSSLLVCELVLIFCSFLTFCSVHNTIHNKYNTSYIYIYREREREKEREANHLVKLFLNKSENVVAKVQIEIELEFKTVKQHTM